MNEIKKAGTGRIARRVQETDRNGQKEAGVKQQKSALDRLESRKGWE